MDGRSPAVGYPARLFKFVANLQDGIARYIRARNKAPKSFSSGPSPVRSSSLNSTASLHLLNVSVH